MKIWINEIQTKGESYTEVNLESVGLTFENTWFSRYVYAVFCRVINRKNVREV